MTDRIAELERQAAALNAELAALKAGQPPKPGAEIEEGGVRVTELFTERSDLPTLVELKKLFGAVKHLAPARLDDRYDEDKPFRGFCAAFRWLQNQGRTERPNGKYAISFGSTRAGHGCVNAT